MCTACALHVHACCCMCTASALHCALMHTTLHGMHTLQVLWMASLPSALFGLGLANCFLFKRYGAPAR